MYPKPNFSFHCYSDPMMRLDPIKTLSSISVRFAIAPSVAKVN